MNIARNQLIKFKLISVLLFLPQFVFSQLDSTKFEELISVDNYKEIIKITSASINDNSVDYLQYRYRGFAHVNQNDLALGYKDYQKAIELNDECKSCYLNLAIIEASKANYQSSFSYLKKAESIDPNYEDVFLLKAKIYSFQNDKLEANINYNKAVTIAPQNARVYMERASFYMNSGSLENALKDVNKSILLNETAEAYLLKTRYYTENGLWQEALENVNKSIGLDSSSAESYYIKGTILYYHNKFKESISTLDVAIEKDPENSSVYENRAISNYALENMDATCADYNIILNLERSRNYANVDTVRLKRNVKELCDENYSTFYYQRGIAEYNKVNYEKAIEYYDLGLAKFSNSSLLNCFKGNALMMLNKNDLAIAYFNKSLRLDHLLEKEISENARFDNNEASKMYEKSILSTLYSNIAASYFVENDYDNSVLYCDSTLTYLNKNKLTEEIFDEFYAKVYLILSIIQNDRGDFIQAKKTLLKAEKYKDYLDKVYLLKAMIVLNEKQVFDGKVRMVNLGLNNQNIPIQMNVKVPALSSKKSDRSLHNVLSYLNRSISLNTQNPMSYYLRAVVKLDLGKSNYCYDILKAKELGYIDVEQSLGVSCD